MTASRLDELFSDFRACFEYDFFVDSLEQRKTRTLKQALPGRITICKQRGLVFASGL